MTSYSGISKFFHWIMMLALMVLIPVGFYMENLPLSPEKLKLYSWHKWMGITFLVMVGFRLAWKVLTPQPKPLPGPTWQHMAASVTHALMYALMVIIPLSGWIMSSAKGFPTVWFGILPLPDLVGKDEWIGQCLEDIHGPLAMSLVFLVMIHVLAVLKHRFIDKDNTLSRMMPFERTKP
jgi:cytochrome b561